MNLIQREKELIDILSSDRNIIVYGTGMIATFVYKRLNRYNLLKKLDCFVRTQSDENESYLGFPVYGMQEKEYYTDDVILVCAIEKIRNEMIQNLERLGMNNYIPISEELFSDMESNYISEKLVDIKGDYDVVFCAQDNNMTSGAFISMACLCEEMQRWSDLKVLVILQRYGDGEQLLYDKKVDFVYAKSSKNWIQSKDKHSFDYFEMDEAEVDYFETIIRKVKAKIVHMSGMFVYAGAVAANRLRIPIVWHIRENIYTQGNDFISPNWAYELINKSSCIIGTSAYALNAYVGLDKSKTCIIHNGADEAQYYAKRAIFTVESVEIVVVGHITKLKGQEIVIKALKIIKERGVLVPHVILVGSGDAVYLEYLRALIKSLNLEENVTFAGRTESPQDYYHKADIAISATSGGEGFDRVRVEAMLSGCLLMTNDMGAARECVVHGKTGYIYSDGDAEYLATLIAHAMENIEESRIIAKRGQDYCLEHFTKEKNAREVLEVYKHILGKDYGREQ